MIFKSIIFSAMALLMCIKLALSQMQGYATMNGGTTGGADGTTENVNTEAQLISAVIDNYSRIVRITGLITLTDRVRVGSNKSVLGASDNAGITGGGGLLLEGVKNVIIRGIRCSFVRDPNDCIEVSRTTNVWIDHNEFWSDQFDGSYGGLIDIVRGSDFVTVSWNHFRNHNRVSSCGNSDNDADTDTDRLNISFQGNWFQNVNSRTPSFRFGTGHIWNCLFEQVTGPAINSRMGAQVLAENNVFVNSLLTIITIFGGFANETNNNFGAYSLLTGPFITNLGSVNPPYNYVLQSVETIADLVRTSAGATLTF